MEELKIGIITTVIVAFTILTLQHIKLPENWQDGGYRRHLTKQEKATLAKGDTVDKIHKAYCTVWRTNYDEGPLRVEPGPGKTHTYIPYGHWRRLTKAGELQSDAYYTKGRRFPYIIEYFPNGWLDCINYQVPTVLDGDSVMEGRTIEFTLSQPQDTACVYHYFIKNKVELQGKSFTSFDSKGSRRVPEGWVSPRYRKGN
ncbi:hypothetical protein [Hymenobacter sp. APR13]|uniref:hypothetical protein n=1 Tax=Hymenobacter sp. APR13 TaxID=1356852 RepID=UPI0004E03B1E|nr:hypothetical protein [Hymenobacter sp. APR13]AII54175.1 hypothetical protein N008_19580 [Hymenobacter sp. APR13]